MRQTQVFSMTPLIKLRLVKGDGEIIEEIVSRDRQKAINKVIIIVT